MRRLPYPFRSAPTRTALQLVAAVCIAPFVSTIAFAGTAAGGGEGSGDNNPMTLLFLMFGLMYVVFYFVLIRPQKKQQREHESLVNSLRKGDKILLSSGIHGEVKKVESDGSLSVEIDPKNNVCVRVAKQFVQQVERAEADGNDTETTTKEKEASSAS